MDANIIPDPEDLDLERRFGSLKRSNGFFINRDVLSFCGNTNEAAIFSRMLYWFALSKDGKRKLSVKREGCYWLAKKHSDWEAECGVKERAARASIARLEQKGLIEIRFWRFGGQPVNHYRINWRKAIEVMPDLLKRGDFEVTIGDTSNWNKRKPKSDTECQFDLTSDAKTITINTTPTTTRINNEIEFDFKYSGLNSDDFREGLRQFCTKFGCSPERIFSKLSQLSFKDSMEVLKISEESIENHNSRKEIHSVSSYAYKVIENQVSDFLESRGSRLSGVELNKEITRLIQTLGWSNNKRIAALWEKYSVYQVSELSKEQKKDFCQHLRKLVEG
ncbi:MAG TPA: hypothetical protein VIQ31_05645 [Phormidium sp.]